MLVAACSAAGSVAQLGVRPLESGFRRFAISPCPGRLSETSGSVPTPAGPVTLTWRSAPGGLSVEASGPSELTPVLMPLPEAPVVSAAWNRQPLQPAAQTA